MGGGEGRGGEGRGGEGRGGEGRGKKGSLHISEHVGAASKNIRYSSTHSILR